MPPTPAYVLQQLHRFFLCKSYKKPEFVASVFGSYYAQNGEKSMMYRIMTEPNSIPKRLICTYASPDAPHCPPLLLGDIRNILLPDKTLTPGQRVNLHKLLLEITCGIPIADRGLILADTVDDVPTHGQLASIVTRLLWYTICNERRLARLGRVA